MFAAFPIPDSPLPIPGFRTLCLSEAFLSSPRRRVVITGIGAVTPIGLTRGGLWAGLREQRSAVRSLTRFDPSIFRSHNAAEVNDFVPHDHMEARRAKRPQGASIARLTRIPMKPLSPPG